MVLITVLISYVLPLFSLMAILIYPAPRPENVLGAGGKPSIYLAWYGSETQATARLTPRRSPASPFWTDILEHTRGLRR